MKKYAIFRTIESMDNQIFVEGKKYISAKRAAEITGYTSDYVGQLAREGHVDSKKVGRVRYVDQGQIRSYTVKSDRKKKAAQELKSEISNNTNTETVRKTTVSSDGAVKHSVKETKIFKDKKSGTHASISREKRVTVRDSFVPSPFSDEDIQRLPYTLAGVMAALLILVGPQYMSFGNPLSVIVDTAELAIEATLFDLEDVSREIYATVNNSGWGGVMDTTLEYSDGMVASVISAPQTIVGSISSAMNTTAERMQTHEIDLTKETPMDKMRASVFDAAGSLENSFKLFFNQEEK